VLGILLKKKNKKALTFLKAEKYLTQEGISKVEEFIEKVKHIRPVNGNKLIVHVHEDFPNELIKEVEGHFSANFSVEFRKDTHAESTGVRRDISFKLVADYMENNSKYTLTVQPSLHLYLDDFFKQEKQLTRKVVLLHEERHICAEHFLETFLVKNEIANQLNSDEFPKDNKKYHKFSRAVESEADIIPGACTDSIECAKAFVEEHLTTIAPHNHDSTTTHPTTHARLKSALKIYKLRKAEEKLKTG